QEVKGSGFYLNTLTQLTQRGNYQAAIAPTGTVPGGVKCLVVVAEPAQQTVLAAFAPNPAVDYHSFAAFIGQAQFPTIYMSTMLQSQPTVTVTFSGDSVETYSSTAILRDSATCQFDLYF